MNVSVLQRVQVFVVRFSEEPRGRGRRIQFAQRASESNLDLQRETRRRGVVSAACTGLQAARRQ